ncbi:hypothetical protein l11_05010 [Neisseria weaveri LMG 5135]|nr:hypothetical protein l11_05010 [Neisseria weaveri LMG 5135]
MDAVQGVAAQWVQTYHTDRQTSGQRKTLKCAADGFLQRLRPSEKVEIFQTASKLQALLDKQT